MKNSSIFDLNKSVLRIRTVYREFAIECENKEDAEYLARAVEVYENYQQVREHMGFAIAKLEEVAPK